MDNFIERLTLWYNAHKSLYVFDEPYYEDGENIKIPALCVEKIMNVIEHSKQLEERCDELQHFIKLLRKEMRGF